jgi:hypothetical protein
MFRWLWFELSPSAKSSLAQMLQIEPHQATVFAAELDTNQVDGYAVAAVFVGIAPVC